MNQIAVSQDPTVGASILWQFPGVYGFCPPCVTEAVVVERRETRTHETELRVWSAALRIERWIHQDDVLSYLWADSGAETAAVEMVAIPA